MIRDAHIAVVFSKIEEDSNTIVVVSGQPDELLHSLVQSAGVSEKEAKNRVEEGNALFDP